MSGRWNRLSSSTKLLAYAVAAILAFGIAVGIGAVAAHMVGGISSSPSGERARPDEPGPPGEQVESTHHERADAAVEARQYTGAEQEQTTPQDEQTTYVDEVGEIQANSVDAFLDSHKKLLRYDGLTPGDVEEMRANQAALERFADQASALSAPPKYEEHEDVFLSAIDELHRAAQLAYSLAADPVSATQANFDDYDHLANKAAAGLRRSNEILGKDYKTIGGKHGQSASQ